MTEISIKDGDQFKDKQGRIWTAEWDKKTGSTSSTLRFYAEPKEGTNQTIITLGAFQHALDAHGLTRYENQTNG